jgi:hypothetical protein
MTTRRGIFNQIASLSGCRETIAESGGNADLKALPPDVLSGGIGQALRFRADHLGMALNSTAPDTALHESPDKIFASSSGHMRCFFEVEQ